MNLQTKLVSLVVLAIATIIALWMMMGINYNGYRTVIQTPSGNTYVKFSPGPYLMWFGHAESYPDIITFDFDKSDNNDDVKSINQTGIPVRYQDGGTGTIFGQGRFALPLDEVTMLSLHRAFRSSQGVSFKLIKPIVEEAENLTAGLMSSEEAYTEKRGTFTEWSRDQIQHGKYRTVLQQKKAKEEGTDKEVWKNVPVIATDSNNQPVHIDSDLKTYGILLQGYQITDWDFEAKTLDQISAKREATMGIITAKANADRAEQDAITAKQVGLKNVAIAKYEKEVEKERAVVDAERGKQVATIAAEQKVSVAEQEKLEQEQKNLLWVSTSRQKHYAAKVMLLIRKQC